VPTVAVNAISQSDAPGASGWDVARAKARQAYVSDALGVELLRCVAETADLGRQVGAYGAKVPVADNASDFAKALGLAGRNPN
jgi:hypothetical protein